MIPRSVDSCLWAILWLSSVQHQPHAAGSLCLHDRNDFRSWCALHTALCWQWCFYLLWDKDNMRNAQIWKHEECTDMTWMSKKPRLQSSNHRGLTCNGPALWLHNEYQWMSAMISTRKDLPSFLATSTLSPHVVYHLTVLSLLPPMHLACVQAALCMGHAKDKWNCL